MSYQSGFHSLALGVGNNPRKSGDGQTDYRRLRDLRSAARDEERKQESQDSADRQLGITKQWSEIANLSARILAETSRDIEVAIWLIEAETRLNGAAGMENAFSLMTEMIESHGTSLHPQPEDDDDRPFDMIAALNGVGREGTLIQPLRLMPLVEGAAYGTASLWSTQTGGEDSVATAISQAGPGAARAQLVRLGRAREAVARCDDALSALLGADAPPFSQIQEVLEQCEGVLRRVVGASESAVTEAATDGPIVDVGDGPAEPGARIQGAIRNREEAFDQLLRIARYFRQAEPHSPMADTLETLVRRGRMDFLTLIEELIPDPNARQAVMTTAGIGKSKPKGG